jgi:GTP-binding protein HflX
VVAIVGYTNAGKSTLLNTLTNAGVLAENRLFATLDTRARQLRLPDGRGCILTDTVGFIRDMPKDLFRAFRSTFEEAADADLLLEIVDAHTPEQQQQVRTTTELLEQLGLDRIPRLVVYNKVDLLGPGERSALEHEHGAIAISAIDRQSARQLLERIAAVLPSEHGRAFDRTDDTHAGEA